MYFWKSAWPLLRELARRSGTSVNRLVNLAVQSFVGACEEEDLKVWAEIGRLCWEDGQLRRVSSTMLRSGSYLPQYADRLFRPPFDRERAGPPYFPPRRSDVPLRALNVKEEKVMRRVLARREAIAQEIAGLLGRVLPEEKFRLRPRRSRVRRRTGHKSVKNVRTRRSDV